jgi:hypothetical protein
MQSEALTAKEERIDTENMSDPKSDRDQDISNSNLHSMGSSQLISLRI